MIQRLIAAAFAVSLFAACNADFQSGTTACAASEPRCPDGYTCSNNKICFKNDDPARPDAAVPLGGGGAGGSMGQGGSTGAGGTTAAGGTTGAGGTTATGGTTGAGGTSGPDGGTMDPAALMGIWGQQSGNSGIFWEFDAKNIFGLVNYQIVGTTPNSDVIAGHYSVDGNGQLTLQREQGTCDDYTRGTEVMTYKITGTQLDVTQGGKTYSYIKNNVADADETKIQYGCFTGMPLMFVPGTLHPLQ